MIGFGALSCTMIQSRTASTRLTSVYLTLSLSNATQIPMQYNKREFDPLCWQAQRETRMLLLQLNCLGGVRSATVIFLAATFYPEISNIAPELCRLVCVSWLAAHLRQQCSLVCLSAAKFSSCRLSSCSCCDETFHRHHHHHDTNKPAKD